MDILGEPGPPSQLAEQLPDALVGQFAAAHGEKNLPAGFFADQLGTAGLEITLQRLPRAGTDRDQALFVAFADHADEALLEIEIFQPGPAEFGDAQAAGVEQFHNGPVAYFQGSFAAGGMDQSGDFRLGERIGQVTLDFRHAEEFRRITLENFALHEETEKNAQGHGMKLDRRRCGTAFLPPTEEVADCLGSDLGPLGSTFLVRRPLREKLERGTRAQLVVVGQPTLGGQIQDELVCLRVHAGRRARAIRS